MIKKLGAWLANEPYTIWNGYAVLYWESPGRWEGKSDSWHFIVSMPSTNP
jgi:hypothetical protein